MAAPTSGTRALVLDFGGVISRTLFETHDVTERALGLAPGSLRWRGPFDPAHDPLWRDMQEGRITERDYWLIRARETGVLVGERWDRMETLVQRARGAEPALAIRPEAVAAVDAAAAAGCRLAVLSNELDLFYGADFRRRLPLLDRFDTIVDATYSGILKPDPRAYAAVTDALGVAAADCVFVDDQARNVEGGRAAGMAVVHFDVQQPAVSYRQALALLGVAVPAGER
ncbi:MAG: HAD-IA family hydrolase [Aquabacterium sp.]